MSSTSSTSSRTPGPVRTQTDQQDTSGSVTSDSTPSAQEPTSRRSSTSQDVPPPGRKVLHPREEDHKGIFGGLLSLWDSAFASADPSPSILEGTPGWDLKTAPALVHNDLTDMIKAFLPDELTDVVFDRPPPASQTQPIQSGTGVMPAFGNTVEDFFSGVVPLGMQLQLGPIRTGPGQWNIVPATYLGWMTTSGDEVFVLRVPQLLNLKGAACRPAQDGHGYCLELRKSSPPPGLCVANRPGALQPVRLGTTGLLELPEGTHLLVTPMLQGSAGRATDHLMQPAIFLRASQHVSGETSLGVRAPWAPAHRGGSVDGHGHEDKKSAGPHYRPTLMRRGEPDKPMTLITTGTVPQPGNFIIGQGPLYDNKSFLRQSDGWYEWEAILPQGTTVIRDPYFLPAP